MNRLLVPSPHRRLRPQWVLGLAVALLVSACSDGPPPRSYDYFLLDKIARDGKIAGCDRDPVAAQRDIECANARRAATAVQLREERERRQALERESEAKIEAIRREFEAQRQAEAAAAAAAAAAYDELWLDPAAEGDATGGAAAETTGAPSGRPVTP